MGHIKLYEAYIKDLDKYNTKMSGLDADEREQWRQTIKDLGAQAEKEKNPTKKKELQNERMSVFQSFSYWKSKYQNKK